MINHDQMKLDTSTESALESSVKKEQTESIKEFLKTASIQECMSRKSDGTSISDTIYDDVMKTMCERHLSFLIPLINRYFGEHYSIDADIELLNNEHHKDISRQMQLKVTDAYFRITENGLTKSYHLECQSNTDSSMILRIVEYDFLIAIDEMANNISSDRYSATVTLPETMVIYLRHSEQMPDKFQVNIKCKNQTLKYEVPIIKTQTISLEEMCEEQLYFFLPFYLMRYENQIKNGNEEDIIQILTHIESFKSVIQELVNSQKLNAYSGSQFLFYARNILEKMAESNKNVTAKERMVTSMSGQIITTKLDEIYEAGEVCGEARGEARGEANMTLIFNWLYDNGRTNEATDFMRGNETTKKRYKKEYYDAHKKK